MNTLARRIAQVFQKKDWVAQEDIPWLIYVLERRLLSGIFYALIFIVGITSGSLMNIISFVVPFIFFRSKMGGWHAPSPPSCFILSLVVVVVNVFIIEPALRTISVLILVTVNMIALFVVAIAKPIYPTSSHFDAEVAAANNAIKKRAIVPFGLLQLLSLYCRQRIMRCGFLAIITVLFLLFVQIVINKLWRVKDEKH